LNDAEKATVKANRASKKATTPKQHVKAARLHAKAKDLHTAEAADMNPSMSFGHSTQADVHDQMMKHHACKAIDAELVFPVCLLGVLIIQCVEPTLAVALAVTQLLTQTPRTCSAAEA